MAQLTLNISSGWNHISFNLTPNENSINSLISNSNIKQIISSFDTLWLERTLYDERDTNNIFNNFKLNKVQYKKGYYINTNSDDNIIIEIEGTVLLPRQRILYVHNGWNYISNPFDSTFDNLDIQTIINNYTDDSTLNNINLKLVDNKNNNSGNLSVGNGYYAYIENQKLGDNYQQLVLRGILYKYFSQEDDDQTGLTNPNNLIDIFSNVYKNRIFFNKNIDYVDTETTFTKKNNSFDLDIFSKTYDKLMSIINFNNQSMKEIIIIYIRKSNNTGGSAGYAYLPAAFDKILDTRQSNTDGSKNTLTKIAFLTINNYNSAWYAKTISGNGVFKINDTVYRDFVILHELLHCFGMGYWNPSDKITDNNNTSWYTGVNGVREYNSYFDSNWSNLIDGIKNSQTISTNWIYKKLPIENDGGGGTEGVHPEEGFEYYNEQISQNNRVDSESKFHPGLDNEISTGWVEGSSYYWLPISRISIGFLQDLGYDVNYENADFYLPPLLSNYLLKDKYVKISLLNKDDIDTVVFDNTKTASTNSDNFSIDFTYDGLMSSIIKLETNQTKPIFVRKIIVTWKNLKNNVITDYLGYRIYPEYFTNKDSQGQVVVSNNLTFSNNNTVWKKTYNNNNTYEPFSFSFYKPGYLDVDMIGIYQLNSDKTYIISENSIEKSDYQTNEFNVAGKYFNISNIKIIFQSESTLTGTKPQ